MQTFRRIKYDISGKMEIIMKKYKVIAFDLDGTLTNPEKGQLTGFEYALKRHGISYPSREWLKRYIGPPIHDLWQEDFGLSLEQVCEMIDTYREYYNVYGFRENDMYDGIPEVLDALKQKGYTLIIATGKPEGIANKILHLFGLDRYFDFVGGATEDDSRHRKCDVLRYALDNIGAKPEEAILIGDRKFDAEGAMALGADSLGVLWGHGTRDEIFSAGFNYTVERPEEILDLLL